MCRSLAAICALVLALGLCAPALAQANGSGTDYQSPSLTLTGNCASPGACAAGTFSDFQTAGTVLTVVQITAASSCTLNFGVSNDDVNISSFPMLPLGATSTVTSASAVGTWTNASGQFAHFYVYTSGCAGGSITFTVRVSATAPSTLAGNNGTVGVSSLPSLPTGANNIGTVTAIQSAGANLHIVCDLGCQGENAWSSFVVPATTACVSANVCVIKATAGTLAALINESTSSQTAGTCTLYDNASAASGKVLYPEFMMGPGQVITFTAAGFAFSNGLTIQCTVTPGGNGLLVLYS